MTATSSGGDRTLFVISDSTGETAAMVARAVVEQFEHNKVKLHIVRLVKSEKEIRQVFVQARACKGLVVLTLVDPQLQRVAEECVGEGLVPVIDIMTPFVGKVGAWLDQKPLHDPGRHHRRSDVTERNIAAFEFTRRTDDGKRAEEVGEADIVVLGVSRSSKTPVCYALAFKGYKAANCPLVFGARVVYPLEQIDPRRVFLLQVSPVVLAERRRMRLAQSGQGETAYTDLREIRKELAWVAELARKFPGWTPIDATHNAIEETAAEILSHYTKRFGDPTL